jgi:hypothetical protein
MTNTLALHGQRYYGHMVSKPAELTWKNVSKAIPSSVVGNFSHFIIRLRRLLYGLQVGYVPEKKLLHSYESEYNDTIS